MNRRRPAERVVSLRRLSRGHEAPDSSGRIGDAAAWGLRRWDGAENTRLNRQQWRGAFDQSINYDLGLDLVQLRARAHHLMQTNSLIEGLAKTYVNNLIGSDGPTLEVQSEDLAFNEKAETGWAEWWASPDAAGKWSGTDLLRIWNLGLWPDGEYLVNLVTRPDAEGKVKLRLQTISPRRLVNPLDRVADPRLTLGVETNTWGQPIQYHIQDELIISGQLLMGLKSTPYPASQVIHFFEAVEPDQYRGVPWLASALQTAADLKSYDNEVLHAARMAARFSAVLESPAGEDPIYVEPDTSMELKSDVVTAIPPGFTVKQMTPQQPMSEYENFRKERQMDLGRGRDIPLMLIRLDSSEHSFSGARMDSQLFQKGLSCHNGMTERVTLNRIFKAFIREFALANRIQVPKKIIPIWSWQDSPYADRNKESAADRMELENGTITLTEILARKGKSLDSHIALRVRENALLEAADLPPVPSVSNSPIDVWNPPPETGGSNEKPIPTKPAKK